MNPESKAGTQSTAFNLSDRSLARIGWLLPLVTVTCSMGVHLISGNARDVPFFISESDYPGIERWIFTTGLALTGSVLCILSYRFRNMFDTSEQITKLRISHTSGMTTGISLVVLAFANMYDYLVLHCIASIFVFGGGLIWGSSTHFLFDITRKAAKKLRRVGLIMALFGFVIMNLIIMLYVAFNRSNLTQNGSLQFRLDELQPVIDFAAPAEYILFLGLIITMASIDWDLKENGASHSSD